MRVGLGHDTHRLVAGRPLILGGVRVPFERGLAGHSDADVVLHAVTDAVLGASGMGDIGDHFPDSDPRWLDADSVDLLATVVEEVTCAGWVVVNADVIIHAQAPRLGDYKNMIAFKVATLLRVDRSAVNVKAKTGEHVGPIGRGEAIECQAVVLLDRAPADAD